MTVDWKYGSRLQFELEHDESTGDVYILHQSSKADTFLNGGGTDGAPTPTPTLTPTPTPTPTHATPVAWRHAALCTGAVTPLCRCRTQVVRCPRASECS